MYATNEQQMKLNNLKRLMTILTLKMKNKIKDFTVKYMHRFQRLLIILESDRRQAYFNHVIDYFFYVQ